MTDERLRTKLGRSLLIIASMFIVTTVDPFYGQHEGESWKHEKASISQVGVFSESSSSQ